MWDRIAHDPGGAALLARYLGPQGPPAQGAELGPGPGKPRLESGDFALQLRQAGLKPETNPSHGEKLL